MLTWFDPPDRLACPVNLLSSLLIWVSASTAIRNYSCKCLRSQGG